MIGSTFMGIDSPEVERNATLLALFGLAHALVAPIVPQLARAFDLFLRVDRLSALTTLLGHVVAVFFFLLNFTIKTNTATYMSKSSSIEDHRTNRSSMMIE